MHMYVPKTPIFISATKTYYSAKPTDQQRQSLMTMHKQCLLYDKQCLLSHHYVILLRILVGKFYWQIFVAHWCDVHRTGDAPFLIFLKRINHKRVFRLVLAACLATCRRILDVDINYMSVLAISAPHSKRRIYCFALPMLSLRCM